MGSLTTPRLIGEVLGTALLVFFGVGALFASNQPDVGAASLLATVVLLCWIFPGGHFNPWVSLASAIRGTLDWISAGLAIAAQLVGAVIGGLFLLAVFNHGADRGLGATRLAPEASSGSGLIAALLAETLVIFVLACVVFALDGKAQLGLGMGLAYAAGTLTIIVVSGASLNLARTFGPEVALLIGGGETDWAHLWVYIVAGVLGSALAGLLYPMWNPASVETPKAQEE